VFIDLLAVTSSSSASRTVRPMIRGSPMPSSTLASTSEASPASRLALTTRSPSCLRLSTRNLLSSSTALAELVSSRVITARSSLSTRDSASRTSYRRDTIRSVRGGLSPHSTMPDSIEVSAWPGTISRYCSPSTPAVFT